MANPHSSGTCCHPSAPNAARPLDEPAATAGLVTPGSVDPLQSVLTALWTRRQPPRSSRDSPPGPPCRPPCSLAAAPASPASPPSRAPSPPPAPPSPPRTAARARVPLPPAPPRPTKTGALTTLRAARNPSGRASRRRSASPRTASANASRAPTSTSPAGGATRARGSRAARPMSRSMWARLAHSCRSRGRGAGGSGRGTVGVTRRHCRGVTARPSRGGVLQEGSAWSPAGSTAACSATVTRCASLPHRPRHHPRSRPSGQSKKCKPSRRWCSPRRFGSTTSSTSSRSGSVRLRFV